jgi:putative intracellular protease/amidase
MVKQILLFLYEGFAEFEITTLSWGISEHPDFEIITIAYDMNPITSNSGFHFLPDKKVSEIVSLDDVAAIIIPGGSILDLRDELKNLILECDRQNKLLGAICAGPQYLAACNLLENRIYTTSRTHERYLELKQEDPFRWENYREERWIQDGNIITSKGYAFNDFALAIWSYLGIISTDDERKQWKIQLNIQ